jgi:hypothetical protein
MKPCSVNWCPAGPFVVVFALPFPRTVEKVDLTLSDLGSSCVEALHATWSSGRIRTASLSHIFRTCASSDSCITFRGTPISFATSLKTFAYSPSAVKSTSENSLPLPNKSKILVFPSFKKTCGALAPGHVDGTYERNLNSGSFVSS